MSDSLWLHGLQDARLPCPLPTPGACSDSCLLSQWCHPTISSCHPLLLLPSIFPSIRVFSNESGLFQWVGSSHQVAKILEFQLQHQSFQWTPRIDLLWDGLVGSPCSPSDCKSLLQHHSSKASVLQYSAFFIVQLSHPYMTIGKTIALTRWTFVGKIMSLLLRQR